MQFIIIFLTLLNLTIIDIESKEIFINENDFQIVFTSKNNMK